TAGSKSRCSSGGSSGRATCGGGWGGRRGGAKRSTAPPGWGGRRPRRNPRAGACRKLRPASWGRPGGVRVRPGGGAAPPHGAGDVPPAGEWGRDGHRAEPDVPGGEEASGPVPAAGDRHRAWDADGVPERTRPEALALSAVERVTDTESSGRWRCPQAFSAVIQWRGEPPPGFNICCRVGRLFLRGGRPRSPWGPHFFRWNPSPG